MVVEVSAEVRTRKLAPPAAPRPPAPLAGPSVSALAARPAVAGPLARALDNRRLFILLPFAGIVGIATAYILPALPEALPLLVVGAALLAIGLLARRSLATVRLVTLLAALWAGLGLLPLHAAMFGTEMLQRPAYGVYEAQVDEVLTENEDGQRVIVSGITAMDGARALPIRRARLVLDAGVHLAPGDRVRAPIRFYPVPGPVVPDGFDTRFHAFFDGIGAYGTGTGAVERIAEGQPSAPARFIDAIRRGIAARIDTALPQPAGGIARALITGDQSEVTDEARDTMAAAGLAHVLSVSGLHLTIVAGGTFVLFRLLLSQSLTISRFASVKRIAAVFGILAGLFYFAISGGNVAALRSTIMILLVLGAVVFGRRALTMRNVAIAALIILVTDPASVLRPSFQLSFAAVVALIGVWEMVRPGERGQRSLWTQFGSYFGGIAATSLVAGLATLLFSVFHFQQTSPLGILGNLFSLPLVGFVMMPAAAIATLLMPLGWEEPFLFAMGWSIDRMLDLGTLVASWSGGIDASPLLRPVALVLGLAAFAWFAFLETWHRLIAPALLLPAVVLFALDSPPDLLISDSTQALAMRGEAGLELVAGRDGTFAVEVWRETYGETITPGALLRCDSIGCFGSSPAGFVVALALDPAAVHEDCPLADLIVARFAVHAACGRAAIIDADDLEQGGVHWLSWTGAGFEVRPAIPAGLQPWRVTAN